MRIILVSSEAVVSERGYRVDVSWERSMKVTFLVKWEVFPWNLASLCITVASVGNAASQ